MTIQRARGMKSAVSQLEQPMQPQSRGTLDHVSGKHSSKTPRIRLSYRGPESVAYGVATAQHYVMLMGTRANAAAAAAGAAAGR